jgi:hypothetical protein
MDFVNISLLAAAVIFIFGFGALMIFDADWSFFFIFGSIFICTAVLGYVALSAIGAIGAVIFMGIWLIGYNMWETR